MNALRILALLVLVATAAGCSGDAGSDPNDGDSDAGSDVGADADSTGDATDAGDDADARADDDTGDDTAADAFTPTPTCGPDGPIQTVVVQQLWIAGEEEPGVAWGFDLDGRDSDASDPMGCGKLDLESPNGDEGIDNQFARILPTIVSLAGESPDAQIQNAINNGELLLLFEMEGVDDLAADACVGLNLYRAEGPPTLGTDGFVLPGQSFDIDIDEPWARVDEGAVDDATFAAGPFELAIPIDFFDTHLDIRLYGARVAVNFHDDGTISGVIAGGARIDELMETAEELGGEVVAAAGPLLGQYADLEPRDTGGCAAISLAFAFEAVPAHLFEDTPRP